MADFGIYTKNADIQARAGENANTTAKAVAATDIYVLNVESTINSLTRFNWSDAFTAGLNVDVQGVLTDTGASMCAMNVINADMSGFTSRTEAQTMLDVLNNNVQRNLSILRDRKVQTFINDA
jgi:hypothetical protein